MNEPLLNPGMNFDVTLAVRVLFARDGNEVPAVGREHVVGLIARMGDRGPERWDLPEVTHAVPDVQSAP